VKGERGKRDENGAKGERHKSLEEQAKYDRNTRWAR
jgi:hypothetical protein